MLAPVATWFVLPDAANAFDGTTITDGARSHPTQPTVKADKPPTPTDPTDWMRHVGGGLPTF